jgi:choline dehydrogenase-like flavoprotein
MIKDFNDYRDGDTLTADICIVGAGVAGLSIAAEFLGTGCKILLLESGGKKDEAATQRLYQSDVMRLPHDGVHNGRFRVYGGSSTRWGAQLMTLEPLDFSARSYIGQSGWPIDYETVAPHYDRAQNILRVNDLSYEEDLWQELGIEPLPFERSILRYRFSKWPAFKHRNLAKTVGPQVETATNIDVLLHANLVEIVPDPGGSTVESLNIKSLHGRSAMVHARTIIICTGAIEVARILLASNSVIREGVGNQSGIVGRYFQDHISIRVARLNPADRQRFTQTFDPAFHGDTMHSCKLAMTSTAQAQHRTLNIMGHVVFGFTEESGLYELRKVLRAVQSKKNPIPSPLGAWRIMRYSSDIFRMAFGQYLARRRLSPKLAKCHLALECEQAPSADSRVMLSSEKDALGMPKTVLDWRLSDLEKHSIQVYTNLFRQEWERLEMGDAEWNQVIDQPGDGWIDECTDTYHHAGTTRMSHDPRSGVVDGNLKVHGLDNLYIASTSVFPSSGCGNPTLTMMALCMRLADRLKAR